MIRMAVAEGRIRMTAPAEGTRMADHPAEARRMLAVAAVDKGRCSRVVDLAVVARYIHTR